MGTQTQALEQAMAHHRAGDLPRAEALCRQILASDPRHAQAIHLLGVLAYQGRRPDLAVGYLRSALAIDPTAAAVHNSLGEALRALDQCDEAKECFQRAIELGANLAAAHYNLAVTCQQENDVPGAIAEFREALRLAPQWIEAHNELGNLLQAAGRLDEAIAAFREAGRLRPDCAEIQFNLGNTWRAAGNSRYAEACYRQALQLAPGLAPALNNLGSLRQSLGDFAEAEQCFEQAVRAEGADAEAHYNLGVVLERRGELARAQTSYERVIALRPDHAQAHYHLGTLLQSLRQGKQARAAFEAAVRLQPHFPEAYHQLAMSFNDADQLDAALECCRQGLAQEPGSGPLWANLATVWKHLGQLDEAIACARKSIELLPQGVVEHSNLLYLLNYSEDYDPATVYREHLAWAARHAEPLTAQAAPHANDRSADRRLRIGYVSPYFREHAVNFFTEPMIAAHDHRRFEVFCYSDVTREDRATRRLRAAADHWREVRLESDSRLADMVRRDAIDILVDLTGHISGNRLLAFARKPAPIQVTYIGYQNTTGMSAMDYRLTDSWADPPGTTDAFYSEALVGLPRSFFCYRPWDDAPPVAPLPALEQGGVTFGAFNNFSKVGPRVIGAWLALLERVAGSRLLLLARGGGFLEQRFEALARQRGLDPSRIEFCDKRPRPDYLDLFARVDIALDPFPFNGHTTTCDSLWMGVPVVMLAGNSYASRFGGSVLANVGLHHLIAATAEQYVEIAAALAGDLDGLARLRAELRPRMADSALLDTAGFTCNLEAAYRRMWSRWCAQTAAETHA